VAEPGRPRDRGRPPRRHGVAVLLKIYAHCIDGQAQAANQRIADALEDTEDAGPDEDAEQEAS